jgi:hypothetical protein
MVSHPNEGRIAIVTKRAVNAVARARMVSQGRAKSNLLKLFKMIRRVYPITP